MRTNETSDTVECHCGSAENNIHKYTAETAPWVDGRVETSVGEFPRVETAVSFADRLGSWKVRWGIGRSKYRVGPGLYGVGNPTAESPVLVSANYKMSFDRLRSELGGLDAWILVLDTKGVNVWCAAGKGTFGTDELVERVETTGLDRVVSHRTLIAPQLGAPGVAAHEVKKRSGFRVVYGPVRAGDLRAFLNNGMKAERGMRRVTFGLWDRVVQVPADLVGSSAKYLLAVALAFLLLSGLGPGGYSAARIATTGLPSVALLVGAYLGGVVAAPLLLPWLPGRAFSAKGAWVGFAASSALVLYWLIYRGPFESLITLVSWVLIIPAVTSFLAMNFTGSSTYTSLSGVKREMRVAVPLQIGAAAIGLGLWITGLFV
ncbi:MAG: acetyl-CoA synthase subunit gamma [Candidatus Coatesbacteria bacterium]|nr:MAG: acetyl-CoA synthase subunit gamma [Candidatus Coatesbacteria bacterium]